jgi:hypothetical protein
MQRARNSRSFFQCEMAHTSRPFLNGRVRFDQHSGDAMPKVYFGRKDEPGFDLELSDDLIAVRTRSGRSITRSAGPVPSPVSEQLDDAKLVTAYPEAGVEVFRVPVGGGTPSLEARKNALRAEPDVRFAGGVLTDPSSGEPVLYTENLFVKFADSADEDACREVLRENGLKVKQEVSYATNAFFVEAAEGTGRQVFDVAQALLQRDDVEYCHPELIRPRARKAVFAQQWHLKKTTINGLAVDAHGNVEAAHQVTRGEGVTIAIIDDGVDMDHPEFAGAGKIVAPRDATLQTDNPRPKDLFGTGPDDGDNHGTACAGVATANGARGAGRQADADPPGVGFGLAARSGRLHLGCRARGRCDLLQLGSRGRALVEARRSQTSASGGFAGEHAPCHRPGNDHRPRRQGMRRSVRRR